MSKKDFIFLIFGTAGGILSAHGVCMAIIWSKLVLGVVAGLVGIVLLLCLISLVKDIE